MNAFHKELVKVINNNLYNYYTDNFDTYRFNKSDNRIVDYFINWLTKFGIQTRSVSIIGLAELVDEFEPLDKVYQMLEDLESKELLTLIFAYRILGHRKVKLPLSNSLFKQKVSEIEQNRQADDFIDTGFMQIVLHRYDLHAQNIPINCYFSAIGIWHDFIARQYEYKSNERAIKANEGDVVIDCGGCWGDTALYFANEVGANGFVYSFEFVDSNIKIFNKNVSLNPHLADRIRLTQRPVWSQKDLPFYVFDKGPASKISLDPIQDAVIVHTQTIDGLVDEANINKVDFIKMDIEGAELNALKGAANTIQRFRPKLAIAVYHKVADFHAIPFWINSLGLGYRFYLGHYSIHLEETILFAEVES